MSSELQSPPTEGWRVRLADYLGLERNVVMASSAVFLLGLGEGLWKSFMPKYLESFGAGAAIIGLFGTVTDLLDALYQYPGGWLADHLGRRRAFRIFIGVAFVGYLVYLVSPDWRWLFAGLALAMVWNAMASPAIFAVIGDGLPQNRRAMGFTVQAILRRIPLLISPVVGGALIVALGVQTGIHIGLAITLMLAAAALASVRRMDPVSLPPLVMPMRGVWRAMDPVLRRLLHSDIIIRCCEGLTGIFVVLYATNVIGVSLAEYGLLIAIQMVTAILAILPAAWLADRIGRKPFVIVTFVCFALFPVAVVLSGGFSSLALAFVIAGLREAGEPARKAMIVDLSAEGMRARTVGLYYMVRSLAVTPAAAIGGMLWLLHPAVPFWLAAATGVAGTVVFIRTVHEREVG
jgi:MFS family permease